MAYVLRELLMTIEFEILDLQDGCVIIEEYITTLRRNSILAQFSVVRKRYLVSSLKYRQRVILSFPSTD